MRKRATFCAALLLALLGLGGAVGPGASAASTLAQVNAGAYIVMEASTGQVLLEHNADAQMYPASITKILTMGLALEAKADPWAAMEEEIEMTYEAAHSLIPGAAHVALTENELLKFKDLLYATQIRSANEAAYMLAQYSGAGSKDDFIDQMNYKAQVLGLTGSRFANPSGLPDAEHYTTAYDMGEITRWALGVPAFREIFSTTSYTMQPTNKQPLERVFSTSNYLLVPGSSSYYEGVVGSKTGHTTDAGYTLVTVAQRNGIELICVVMKCPSADARLQSTHALLDYCFDNYSYVRFPAADMAGAAVPVYSGGAEPIGEITICMPDEEAPGFLLHHSLTVDDVMYTNTIPDKYVIGQPFAPTAAFSLKAGSAFQRQELGEFSLHWYGLENVFASYDEKLMAEAAAEQTAPSPWKWVVTGAVAAVICLFLGRILYVRRRREKRRRARLEAARAYMPVSSGPRPNAPIRTSKNGKYGEVLVSVPVARGAANSVDFRQARRAADRKKRCAGGG